MKHVARDLFAIAISVVIAFLIAERGLVGSLLSRADDMGVLGSFIGGLFFTSIFTTAPAIVVLGEIGRAENLIVVGLVGAMGSVIGDIIIFYLFKNHVAKDIENILKMNRRNRFWGLIRSKSFRWVGITVGALIISSPLPDELGIALMGFSRMENRLFVPVYFGFNFLGIVLIGLAARVLT